MKKTPWFWILAIVVIIGIFYYGATKEKYSSRVAQDGATQEQVTEDTDAIDVQDEDKAEETSPDKKSDEEKSEKQEVEQPVEGFTLSAEPLGDGEVKFVWQVPEDLVADKYILVRDDEKNPVHDGTNYWYRQFDPKREAIWNEQPTGTQHYRICRTIDEEGEECGEYSNDVEIEVK